MALAPRSVATVACGSSINAVILEDGSVLTWGIGECGELGRPTGEIKGTDGEYDTCAPSSRAPADKPQGAPGLNGLSLDVASARVSQVERIIFV